MTASAAKRRDDALVAADGISRPIKNRATGDAVGAGARRSAMKPGPDQSRDRHRPHPHPGSGQAAFGAVAVLTEAGIAAVIGPRTRTLKFRWNAMLGKRLAVYTASLDSTDMEAAGKHQERALSLLGIQS